MENWYYFVAIAVAFMIFSTYRSFRAKSVWQDVATELGLASSLGSTFRPGAVQGSYTGLKVSLVEEFRGSGRSQKSYTVLTCELAPYLDLNFRLLDENFLRKVGKAIGDDDIETGDQTFDEKFIIRGLDADKVLRLLTHKNRRLLCQTRDLIGPFSVDDFAVKWERRGLCTDKELLTQAVVWVTKISRALSQSVALLDVELEEL